MATKSAKKSTEKKTAAKKKTIRSRSVKKNAVKEKTIKSSSVKKNTVKEKANKKDQKPVARSPAKTENKITLNSVLAINDAKTLYAELGDMLKAKRDIFIDASAVEMVDAAILQMLLAFIQKSQLQSISVTWVKSSKEFVSRAEILDLTGALGLKGA